MNYFVIYVGKKKGARMMGPKQNNISEREGVPDWQFLMAPQSQFFSELLLLAFRTNAARFPSPMVRRRCKLCKGTAPKERKASTCVEKWAQNEARQQTKIAECPGRWPANFWQLRSDNATNFILRGVCDLRRLKNWLTIPKLDHPSTVLWKGSGKRDNFTILL